MNRTSLPLEALFPKLMRLAVARTRRDSDAEDLVNDTFLAVLRAIAAGKEIENTEAYAVRTLENLFHKRLREKYGTPIMSIHEDLFSELSSDEPSIEDALISREETEALRREVSYLAKNYREAIVRFYLHGESVEMIANSLSIPEGTVKSRLDTGRKTLRKGLTMKNYDTQSYEPKTIGLSLIGSDGMDGSPFSTLRSSDLLGQNILICAYAKPLFPTEIAKTLGVATCYVEAELEKLTRFELMKKTKDGKYGTDMLMIFPEEADALMDRQLTFASTRHDAVIEVLKEGFDGLLKKPYLSHAAEQTKRCALAYFGYEATQRAIATVINTIHMHPSFDHLPERPEGGRWFATAHVNGGKKDLREPYAVSGTLQHQTEIDGKEILLLDNSTAFGRTHQSYRARAKDVITILSLIRAEKGDELESHLLKFIPCFTEHGMLETKNGKITVCVPFFTKEEMNDLAALIRETQEKLSSAIGKDVKAHILKNCPEIPPHVKSVCEWNRLYQTVNLLPMMFLLEAEKKGDFPISLRDENGELHAPAMLLVEQ